MLFQRSYIFIILLSLCHHRRWPQGGGCRLRSVLPLSIF